MICIIGTMELINIIAKLVVVLTILVNMAPYFYTPPRGIIILASSADTIRIEDISVTQSINSILFIFVHDN